MISNALHFPPLDYSLLFADLINFHLKRNPNFPIFAYSDNYPPNKLTEISFLEFGRAAHRVAHALRPSRQGRDGEIVMIIASSDTILYHAVLTGLFIAGWVPFPVSPRNSAVAVVNMMKKTNCSRIVTLENAHKGLIYGIRHQIEGRHLTILEFPTLRYTFPKLGKELETDAFVPYPSSLERPDLDSPAIYIHSSGSTGFPKPIAHSHRIQIQWMGQPLFCENAELPGPRRIGAMALPAFHAFGLAHQLYLPIACLVTAVVYPPRTEKDPFAQPVIPTSDNMIEYLQRIECNTLLTVPTFLEHMAASDEAISILKKMQCVHFGGGPLPVKVGQKLWAAGVQLASGYGGTEFGAPVAMPNKQDIAEGDWMWLRFSGDLKLRWAPQGDGTYELQILSPRNRQMAVENLPDLKGYATADLFVKHPAKEVWRIVGRIDDVITLASGEKTVPAPMESVIGSSPLVRGVIMFGRERNQVGVLIEPDSGHAIDISDENAVAEFKNQIWPVIEEANKPAPAFSRIFKQMILITSGNKPMLRAPKGTVQRRATLKAYEAEINALYDAIGASTIASDGLAGPSAWTAKVLEGWLLQRASAVSSNNRLDPHVDLFAQGFDSLSVTFLRNEIIGALRASLDPRIKTVAARVPLNIVFENPTINVLSSRIAAFVNDDGGSPAIDIMEQHKHAINAMIEKYSIGLGGPTDGMLPNSEPIAPAVVLVTGTTGGLGSFLLSELLKTPAVQRIFALNRPSKRSIEERQKSAFEDRGLSVHLLGSSKLVYLESDASLEKCGLSPTRYEELQNSLTLIIHNAWRLDFNLALSSFEENVRASRNLVDLGLGSVQNKNLRFLFTSSVGSAQSWDNEKGPYPEEVQLDPTAAIGSGYGEGKYATERMIVQSGLHATSFRIGQIAGGSGGFWATTDWFPIIVKSSLSLGVLPEAVGSVSWLREEDVASTILETAFAKESPPPALNIVNPRNTTWADIIASVRRSIIHRKGLQDDALRIVPFGDWFSLLERTAENPSEDDLTRIPAIKLLEFFRTLARGDEAIRRSQIITTEAAGIANFSTIKAQRVSPTMTNMQAIGDVEADAWVARWIANGVF